MKTSQFIFAYAILVTLFLLLFSAWRVGRTSGKEETLERIEKVLNREGKKKSTAQTFDAICDEFAPEFQ